MKYLQKILFLFCCALIFQFSVFAQQINRVEYFIDTDPGFGNGTPVTITPATSISDLFFTIDLTVFSQGHHQLFIRSRDSNGKWSLTNRWLFFKDIIPANQINRMEYFIDTDPGYGNGSTVSITPGANISNTFFTVDITSLTNGFHNLFIRSRDNNGNWSLRNKWLFFKDIIPPTQINRLEYYIDTDPGFGNGTSIAITPSATISNSFFTADITALTNGFHNIYIRSRDNNGNWSITNKWLFFKDIIPATSITKMEYFVDVDPGFGNGNVVTITPGANISDLAFNVNITALSAGFHKIFLRSLDNQGNWSITNRFAFFKEFIPSPLNVKSGEYFFNTDPGFGNGTAIPFTDPKGQSISEFNFNANIGPLTNNSLHYLFVRVLDSNNNWSLTNVVSFTKSAPVPVTWLSFDAKAVKNTAQLDWKTASEINSSHFVVERSINGFEFEPIGTVAASGNTTTVKSYRFFDRYPKPEMNYYRIQQVDLDDHFGYSEIRKVNFSNELPLFEISNNISEGQNITVRTNQAPSNLGIFDIAGQKLKDIKILNSIQQINLNGLASGTYTAVLYRNGKVLAVEKIVIIR